MIGIGLSAGKNTIARDTPWGNEKCMTREEAEGFARQLAGRRVTDWVTAMNLASALGIIGRNDEAILWASRAVRLERNSTTLFNLAFAYETAGEFGRSFALVEEALRRDPSNPFAGLLYAEGLLRRGNWQEGWLLYERYCWGDAWSELRDYRPEWRGEDIRGKRILILPPAQGCGDLIMFLRWCGELKKCGAYVIYTCSAMMETLLEEHEWIDRLVVIGNSAGSAETVVWLDEFDCFTCLMSLPWVFGSTPETIPWSGPYIKAKRRIETGRWADRQVGRSADGQIGRWADRQVGSSRTAHLPTSPSADLTTCPSAHLPACRKPRVGLCSQAGETNDPRRIRSLSATQTERLLALDSVEWVSLDYGRQPLIEDWSDTAALIDGLDLVVTVDTGVMHLAGAMDKPTWVILPVRSDAKFFLDRHDSPLYPSLRLFRSKRETGMEGAVQEVIRAVESRESRVKSIRVADSACAQPGHQDSWPSTLDCQLSTSRL
jgi:hypothetical protein